MKVVIRVKSDMNVINRKTDNLLDWLGDWGGLLDGLRYVCHIILTPYTSYALQLLLTKSLVRFVPKSSKPKKFKEKEKGQKMEKEDKI